MSEPLNLIKGSKAIADFIGLSQRDVLNLAHQNAIPAFLLGNKLVARPESLREWVADLELRATSNQL